MYPCMCKRAGLIEKFGALGAAGRRGVCNGFLVLHHFNRARPEAGCSLILHCGLRYPVLVGIYNGESCD